MRTATEYLQLLKSLLPRGKAWNTEDDSVLSEFLLGEAEELARVDGRADDLLTERDTRYTSELLTDHEIDLGLPDDCTEEGLTIEARRRLAHAKLITLGQQTPAYFVELAAAYGLAITVTEFSPAWCGVAGAGWCCGPPENIFYWMVTIEYAGSDVAYFLSGSGASGDLLSTITGAVGLECILNRYKPAHTTLIFDYTGGAFSRAFDVSFDSVPTEDTYLNGAFTYAFGSGFDVQRGGPFDNDEFNIAFERSI